MIYYICKDTLDVETLWSPVNSPHKGPWRTRSFDVFFDLGLNERLSKQSWGWWFDTPLRPLWLHCNDLLLLQNIRLIVEEIVAKEKSDIHLALIEYRDHKESKERSFLTRVNDFTASVKEMKTWLEAASASGGGDTPEAVADAWHALLKLNWRENATKICVHIADAPPHGLGLGRDHFPDGKFCKKQIYLSWNSRPRSFLQSWN